MRVSDRRQATLAGAVAVVLFTAAGAVIGSRPPADATGSAIAEHLAGNRTRIQIGCALSAATAPFLTWFFATILSASRLAGPAAERAGTVIFGCGVMFVALYLVDVGALAVSALRAESMAAAPELASALRDLEWLLAAMAAFTMSGLLVACAVTALTVGALWPRWVGWLSLLAAVAYGLRTGALFTVEGPFAADGPLGLWIPVAAAIGWVLAAGATLSRGARYRGATARTAHADESA